MAQSSDEFIKQEIIDVLGTEINGCSLRIFPGSSNEDQLIFNDEEGLTFGINGVPYGSCDAAWTLEEEWINPFDRNVLSIRPVVVLEGTDALNRKSGGNAQYQRFHHALGAVKAGAIGVYYLKRGKEKIQSDLYGMAYNASLLESGTYLIYDCLDEMKSLFSVIHDPGALASYLKYKLSSMQKIYTESFDARYENWEDFSKKRSTIIKDDYVIKHSGRMLRNFTDGSQRAGHIAVGEMYLTKYFFEDKHFYYLWPKMINSDIEYMDSHKKLDKEWRLLRNEPGVTILTIDDLNGVPAWIKRELSLIKDDALKGGALKTYNKCKKVLDSGLRDNSISIRKAALATINK